MKNIFLALALLLIVNANAQSPEFKKNLDAGNTKFASKDYNGAIPFYDKAITLIENDANAAVKAKTQNKMLSEVFSKRGACYYFTGSLSALKNDAEMAMALDSTNGEAKAVLGYSQYKSGEKRKGCASVRKGIVMGAETGNKIFDDCFCWGEGVNVAKEGENEIYGKRYDAAIKFLDQAIAIIPDSGYIYAIRAKAYLEKNQPEKALADMNTAVYKKASSFKVYYLRAQTFVKAGKPDSAFLDLNKCIDLKKDYYDAILLRAEVNEQLQQWNAAIYDYGLLIKLRPDFGPNYYKIALVKHNHLEDLLGACDYYKGAAVRGVEEAKEMAENCGKPKYMKQHLHKDTGK
jgi:tetratricopeptide (TPR) repeat protein